MAVVEHPQYWMFLDGSGKEHSHACVSYCGYLSESTDTEAFTVEWGKVSIRELLPFFSMKDALAWAGPFAVKRAQWGEEADAKRLALFLELADTIRSAKMSGFATAAFVPAFNKQIKPTEYFLFTRVLEMLLPQLIEGSYLAVIVDEEEQYAERIYELFRTLRKRKQEFAKPLKLIGIADDRAFPGLQAADLLARAVMGEMARKKANRKSEPLDELYTRLTANFASKSLHISQLYDDPNEFLQIAGLV